MPSTVIKSLQPVRAVLKPPWWKWNAWVCMVSSDPLVRTGVGMRAHEPIFVRGSRFGYRPG